MSGWAGRWRFRPCEEVRHASLALAHVDDVVAAILDLIDRPGLEGSFAVGGDRPSGYRWREILATAAQAMGRTARFVSIPCWTIRAAAALSERIGRFTASPAIFTPGKAREMLHPDWSIDPAEQAPGAPAARFSLEEGFHHTVAWYRANGWL